MISETFYWIVNMSILGTLAGVLILCLRKIKRIPKFYIYCLWCIPLLRLLIPFGISNKYSLMTLISKTGTRTVVISSSEFFPNITSTNCLMAADEYFPISYKTNTLDKVFFYGSISWFVIFCIAIFIVFIMYIISKSEIKSALHSKDNIFISDQIKSPAVYGIFRPKIILPEGIAKEDMPYIIAHENVHIKRNDNLFRSLAIITACLHWFNPFIWILLKYFFEDMELACDAKVLKNLQKTQQKEYAMAILKCTASKSLCVSAFGGAGIKVRIENILTYKKLSLVSSIYFVLLIISLIIVFLTNAQI